eukprot:6211465-Pleurochrysis_carterae.AAC.6
MCDECRALSAGLLAVASCLIARHAAVVISATHTPVPVSSQESREGCACCRMHLLQLPKVEH